MKVLVVANLAKPNVKPAVDALVPWLKGRVDCLGIEDDRNFDLSTIDVDLIVVMGGDGTLLSVARRLGGRQVPVMGFNFGRLGFLASFSAEHSPGSVQDAIDGKLPLQPRLMIQASVLAAGTTCDPLDKAAVAKCCSWTSRALNDAVITAGSPFRMIELTVGTDNGQGVRYFGDGMILCTASGSTAYNISAGGPILSPQINAMCLTPLCPHSLSFRPIVLGGEQTVVMTCNRVNRGTELVVDGQAPCNLNKGDRVVIRRADQPLMLVENPTARDWQALGEKLHWASVPNYNWK